MRVVFDIETDGLLRPEGDKPEATKVHCIVIKNRDTDELHSFNTEARENTIARGLELLAFASEVSGHNILTFDLPMLEKLHGFQLGESVKVLDTLVSSRLIWSDLTATDYDLLHKTRLPNQLIGKHSLEAWGARLGHSKGAFNNKDTDWSRWSAEMQAYCENDVELNDKLLSLIERKNYSPEAIALEHEFQRIIHLQEQNGFAFDTPYAQEAYAKMAAERDKLKRDLQTLFPPRIETMKTPAYWTGEVAGSTRNFGTKGEAQKVKAKNIQAGPLRTKEHPFNPDSDHQIAERLKEKYGWKPSAFTPSGQAKVGDEILSDLPYPEAKQLAEFAILAKRIGQIAEGEQGWLRNLRNGRLYGTLNTNGAVTGRCTHRLIVNVPKDPEPWGLEMRSCFIATPGWFLVGCDASGLEARCQGHFMHPYDGGAFIRAVLEGDKSKGTDIHSINRDALGLEPTKENREVAKTWYYAFLYGSGNFKSGNIVGVTDAEIEKYSSKQFARQRESAKKWLEKENLAASPKNLALHVKGGLLKKQFLEKSPTLAQLIIDTQKEAKEHGYLVGLDGRKIPIRSQHAALNTRFQSAGALVMKKALCLLWETLDAEGWEYGKEFRLVTNVHDEIQAEAPTEFLATKFGKVAAESIKAAGEHFKFLCPLEGEFKVGKNWHETH